MRAAMVTRFGGPDVFEIVTRPDPAPGPGQVAIAVDVADTLWLETNVRSGAGRDYWPMRPPYVPGGGVAGTVTAVGDGADRALLGRRVAAYTGNENGYADRVVTGTEWIAVVPDGLDLTVAAAVLHDGITALCLFDVTKVGAADSVAVVGASGGLGVLSVQLAKARADRVVAIARGAKLDQVRALGPDAVVDSGQADWVDWAAAALPGGAGVVLDNVGGDLGEAAFALTAPGSRLSAHGTPSGRFAQLDRAAAGRRGVTVTGIEAVQLTPAERLHYLREALREAAAGTIAPVIGQVFPLAEAGAAHAAIEGRDVFGKTLLVMS